MSSHEWFIIKALFSFLAGGAGLSSAIFGLWATASSSAEQSNIREWLAAKWHAIEHTRFHDLPEKAICWLVDITKYLPRIVDKIWSSSSIPQILLFASWFPLIPWIFWCVWKIHIITIYSFYVIAVFLAVFLVCELIHTRLRRTERYPRAPDVIECIGDSAALFTMVFLAFITVQSAIAHPSLFTSFLVTVCLVPFGLGLTGALMMAVDRWSRTVRGSDVFSYSSGLYLDVFGIGVAASCSVTMLALILGNLAGPLDWIPRTRQMLASNVVFDGLTLLATLRVLQLSIPPSKKLSIPVAVTLDAVIAACFACASLWLGLAGSDHALGFSGIVRVLFARHPQCEAWNLGAFFWVMHTAFLPTFLYLSLIISCWLAKTLVRAAAALLRRGSQAETNPLALSAALFALLFALFAALSAGAGLFEEAAKAGGN